MDINQLINIGLTKTQARVYLELIKRPGQSPGKLAKKLSLDRSFVYCVLNNLIDKGLVTSVVRENKQVFYATDPENLLKDFEEKRARMLHVVNDLKKIKQQKKEESSVKVYEGKAGLKAYIREVLKTTTFYTLGGGGRLQVLETLKYDYPHYAKELAKKKIKGKVITSQSNKKDLKKVYGSSVTVKTMDLPAHTVGITLFDSKIGMYSGKEKPQVILIENKEITETLKAYFEHVWKNTRN